jgi:hypothetical protein
VNFEDSDLPTRLPEAAITPAPVERSLRHKSNVEQGSLDTMSIERRDSIMQVSIVALNSPSISLSWADDGNLLVDGDGSRALFSGIDNFIVGDTNERFLHLYADTLASLGVSRLRLAALDAMPLPSVLVTLVPITVAQGQSAYIAVTSDGQVYWLITCVIDAQTPKVFLVKDITAGAAKLMDQSLATTFPGGNVTECGYVPWGIVG